MESRIPICVARRWRLPGTSYPICRRQIPQGVARPVRSSRPGTALLCKSATLEAVLPWLYPKGKTSDEMVPALEALLGAEAKGLSASTVSWLKQSWQEEYET